MTLSLEKLATQYIAGKPVDPTMKELMDFVEWVDRRFSFVKRYVDFTEDEVSPDEMEYVWDQTARLRVSTAHNEHPYWSAEVNAKFRAIHDWDHIQGGFTYDWQGELTAAGYAMSTAPDSIKWILLSEIGLQACAAEFTGAFQPQKLVKV